MGANTMVAAIGLVLGPVLGGALVAISWHWVFWFNVPLALAGAAWGALILRELAKPDHVRGYDVLGTITFVVGLTGLVLGVSRGGLSGWNDPVVIVGLAAAAVLLPLWVLIERRSRAPMLDLRIFNNRLFAAASAAAFINGLARFALMFLFVFYFQGAQGNSPIEAGIKLIPLALGMLIASPLAGHLRRPPRLAHAGRARDARERRRAGGDDDARGAHALLAERPVAAGRGRRLGHVQQPQHGRDDGRRARQAPRHRRRRAHARCRTPAPCCRSRSCSRSSPRRCPKATLFAVFSGLAKGLSAAEARAVHRQHARRAVGARRHLAARRRRLPAAPPPRRRARHARPRRSRRGEAALATSRRPALTGSTASSATTSAASATSR